jgi:serine/threonine protein phosphatase PrpC
MPQNETDIQGYIWNAVTESNNKAAEFNSGKSVKKLSFYPGTVGIAAVIRNGILYYAYIGDCIGILFRDVQRIKFSEQQTEHVNYLKHVSKNELYETICNNPENRFGYGIINGDKRSAHFIKVSHLALEKDDIIFLASDGLSKYLLFEKADNILSSSMENILNSSEVYDIPPYAKYSDDKTFIKISVK